MKLCVTNISLLPYTRLCFLAGQNQVNIAVIDCISYPFSRCLVYPLMRVTNLSSYSILCSLNGFDLAFWLLLFDRYDRQESLPKAK